MDLRVDQLDSRDVLEVFQIRWGSAQSATWNTRITALQSFVSYCQRNKWIDHDPMSLVVRRREPHDQTRAIPYPDLEALWSRRDIGLPFLHPVEPGIQAKDPALDWNGYAQAGSSDDQRL